MKEYLIKNVSIFLRNSSPLLRRFYFFSLRPPEDEIYAGVPADFVDVSFGRISALRPPPIQGGFDGEEDEEEEEEKEEVDEEKEEEEGEEEKEVVASKELLSG